MEKNIYSWHTFIFPFAWITDGDYYTKFVRYFEKNSYWDSTNIEDSNELSAYARSDIWGEDGLKLYQEYQYFTPYARKAIYGLDEKIVRNYSFWSTRIHNNARYCIRKDELDYELDLNMVRLKIFNTGVALLIFECENTKYRNIEDVKNINDYGRRITLPFINSDFSIAADSIEVRIDDEISLRFSDGNKKARILY